MPTGQTPMIHIRKFTLRTTTGHSIEFKGPNEPVDVPSVAVQQAMAAGAIPADQSDHQDFSKDVEDRLTKAQREPIGEERDILIRERMRDLIGINNTDDFDGAGRPKLTSLSAGLEFRVYAGDRDRLWQDVKASMTPEPTG